MQHHLTKVPALILDIREDYPMFRLLSGNYRELKRFLDATEDVRVAIRLKGRVDIKDEVARLLYNYASSAMSLVSDTRRVNGKLYEVADPVALLEIQGEIQRRFVDNETYQLIQGLRDYTQHRTLPIVGGTMSFYALGDKPTLEAAYYLSTESLLQWDKWKPLARKRLAWLRDLPLEESALKNIKKDLAIRPLVEEHFQQEASFYKWLLERRRERFPKKRS